MTMEEDEYKLEELKLVIQEIQHFDAMLWNRISFFVALLVFGATILTFGYSQNINNVLLALVSFGLSIMSFFWLNLVTRQDCWLKEYVKRGLKIQESMQKNHQITIEVVIPRLPTAPWFGKLHTIKIIKMLAVAFCLIFIIMGIYFLILPYTIFSPS